MNIEINRRKRVITPVDNQPTVRMNRDTLDSTTVVDISEGATLTLPAEVPVDAFWSIKVCNEDGYMEPNELGRNNYNNVSAKPNDDGSITIHLGGCDDGRVNCIPVTPGWSYAVRLYQPREEILNGSWSFPEFEPVK